MDLYNPKNLIKRALFALLVLILSSQVVFAQADEPPMEDVVYLKNGWILHGTLLEMVPDSSVTIKTWARNVFVFKMEEVSKITKEPRPVRKRPTTATPANLPRYVRRMKPKKETRYKEPGYVALIEAGFLFGRNQWNEPAIRTTLHTAHGYKFFPQLSLSGGIGIDSYNFNVFNDWGGTSPNANVVPLYLDVRGDILKETKSTPYYYAQGGYGFGWLINEDNFENFQGGAFGGFGFGFHFYTGSKMSYTLDLGYKMQAFSAEWREWTWNSPDPVRVSQTGSLRRIVLKTGITF